jgi:hypothetical protein
MAKVKGKVKVAAKKKPIIAGSTMPRNIGGILNAEVVAHVRQKKRRENATVVKATSK